jgi:hypothetical protein
MQQVAAKYSMTFSDEEVYLHGTAKGRDATQKGTPQGIQQYVRRADVVHARGQVDTVMGCPIKAAYETDAYQAALSRGIDRCLDNAASLCEMRDLVVADRLLEYGEQSASALLFAALAFARRSFGFFVGRPSTANVNTVPPPYAVGGGWH